MNETRVAEALERAMALDVIPALLRTRPAVGDGSGARWRPPAGSIAALAAHSLSHDSSAAVRHVLYFLREGVAVEALCEALLAPAARMLGDQWVEDERNIAEVTLGLARLHEALRAVSRAAPPVPTGAGVTPRALLVPVPGEGHVFGAAVLGEHFSQAGWDVWGTPPRVVAELREWVSGEWFDVAGLSVATEARMPALRESIAAVREASCNPGIAVFVGGRLFAAQPALSRQLAADWVSADASSAITAARNWVRRRHAALAG